METQHAQPEGADPVSRTVTLLDEARRERGTADKSTVHRLPVALHRGFSIYLFRGDELLITQRAFAKQTWPGVWSNSCCGHPRPGETEADAARRHLAVELEIVELSDPVMLLADFEYSIEMGNGWGEHEFCPVLGARLPEGVEPVLNRDEVEAYRWLEWAKFVELAALGLTSPWTQLQVEALVAAGIGPESVPD